jgi:O-antigen ligase
VHNVYLSLLTETGALGFLSFFVFIALIFVSSFKNYFRNRDLPSLQALVLIPGFLANSLFDNLLYTVPAGILIWVLIGLSQNRSLLNGHTDEIKEKGLVL